MSLNRITIEGRITADPELRRTQQGKAVTSFSLAVDRDSKGPNGEKQTDFFEFVAWERNAELICQYVTKGRKLAVDGKLQTRGYTDRNGNARKVVEIKVESVYFGEGKPQEERPAFTKPGPDGGYNYEDLTLTEDDDLPY